MKAISNLYSGYILFIIMTLIAAEFMIMAQNTTNVINDNFQAEVKRITNTVNPPILTLLVENNTLYLGINPVKDINVKYLFKYYLLNGSITFIDIDKTITNFTKIILEKNYAGEPLKTGIILDDGTLFYYIPGKDPIVQQSGLPNLLNKTFIDEELVQYLKHYTSNSSQENDIVVNGENVYLYWIGYKAAVGYVRAVSVWWNYYQQIIYNGPIEDQWTSTLFPGNVVLTYPSPGSGTFATWYRYTSFLTYNLTGWYDNITGTWYLGTRYWWLNTTSNTLYINLTNIALGLWGTSVARYMYFQVFRVVKISSLQNVTITLNVSIINSAGFSRLWITMYVYPLNHNLQQPVALSYSTAGSTGIQPWIHREILYVGDKNVNTLNKTITITVDPSKYGLDSAYAVIGVEGGTKIGTNTIVVISEDCRLI